MEDMVFGKFKIKKIKHEEIKKTLIDELGVIVPVCPIEYLNT